MKNNIGLLLPLASIYSRHGIGSMGQDTLRTIDWMSHHHFRYWQILPLNPLGYGNSPYMSVCSNAIDYRYIDLDEIKELKDYHIPSYLASSPWVKYDKVASFKLKWLKIAYKHYLLGNSEGLRKFKSRNPWVSKYATFMVFKKINNNDCWSDWPIYYRDYYLSHHSAPKSLLKEINFIIYMQYVAYNQWRNIISYAHHKNIKIIADMPFYVGYDSVECWTNRDSFLFDENGKQTFVGGVPPDAFSETGQLWGSPIYNFEAMKKNNYELLISRISYLANNCDYLRIDHFRAFDTYYVIDAKADTALNGEWKIGPRDDFFIQLYQKNPRIQLIAEDLGMLFPSVIELRDRLGLPGMYIVQFTLIDEYVKANNNMIVYTGTHDNDTLKGFLNSLSKSDKKALLKRFSCTNKQLFDKVIAHTFSLPSKMTILPIQDVFKLSSKYRYNVPGTVGSPNFCYRIKNYDIMKHIKIKIR